MNIGTLYLVNKWYWLLFSSRGGATADAAAGAFGEEYHARVNSAYLSRRYNQNVTWFAPESYIVFLEENGIYKKILTSGGAIGWIWFDEDLNDCFEEVKSE